MTEGSRQARTIGYLCRGGGWRAEGGEGVWKYTRYGTGTRAYVAAARRVPTGCCLVCDFCVGSWQLAVEGKRETGKIRF